jgi:hypothetical protein
MSVHPVSEDRGAASAPQVDVFEAMRTVRWCVHQNHVPEGIPRAHLHDRVRAVWQVNRLPPADRPRVGICRMFVLLTAPRRPPSVCYRNMMGFQRSAVFGSALPVCNVLYLRELDAYASESCLGMSSARFPGATAR